jgi:hypothetical protein
METMTKYFVLSHHYNDSRSWWEPHFGETLTQAKDLDEMINGLVHDGLYKIYEVKDVHEIQVSTRTVKDREVRRIVEDD